MSMHRVRRHSRGLSICDRHTFSVHSLPWEAHGPPLSAAFSPSLALARSLARSSGESRAGAAAVKRAPSLLPSSHRRTRTCPPRATSKRGEGERGGGGGGGFLDGIRPRGPVSRTRSHPNKLEAPPRHRRASCHFTYLYFPACSKGEREKAASSFLAGGESLCTVSRWEKRSAN